MTEGIDQIVSAIISQPIAEEYATGLLTDQITFDAVVEFSRGMSGIQEVEDAVRRIQALDRTRKCARRPELTIQSNAAQRRLSIQAILSGSEFSLPAGLLPDVDQIECELVNAAIRSYIDQHPDTVDTLISRAREMVHPDLMEVEHYASIERKDGPDAKNRELVTDYLYGCVQNRVMDKLDEILHRAAGGS